jgi:hypothetical protein
LATKLIKLAGPAADGFEAVFPYDPSCTDPRWLEFNDHYEARCDEKPDQFAALAYDAMRLLLDAICRAGLNKGRIRDALTGTETYKGVTGDMVFDPNCKNIAPLFLAHVQNGMIQYRHITMGEGFAPMSRDNPTPPEFLWSKRETDKHSSFLNALALRDLRSSEVKTDRAVERSSGLPITSRADE